MEGNVTPRRRGRPRKKPKIEVEEPVSYEELQAKVQVLEDDNKKLTQLLSRSSRSPVQPAVLEDRKSEKKKNTKNIGCYPKRHVLLKVVYLRWDNRSSASHEETQKTVEDKLLQALLKIGLIEAPETSKFHRFGEANEGFNPFDQVVSIVLRSRLNSGLGVIPLQRNDVRIKEEQVENTDDEDNTEYEIKYSELINEALPSDIRVVAWCPVQREYSTRTDGPISTYKYFFPRGNLNVEMMNEAAQHLVGHHDFINLYKRDTVKGMKCLYRQIYSVTITPCCCDLRAEDDSRPLCDLVDFVRINAETEVEIDVEPVSDNDSRKNYCKVHHKLFHNKKCTCSDLPPHAVKKRNACKRTLSSDGYDMFVLTIEGEDFLWTEIRKIMAVLFRIGKGESRPDALLKLLDVRATYRGQQLSVASDLPLSFSQSIFKGENWIWDNKALHLVISQLQGLWSQHSVQATALKHSLWDFESCYMKNTPKMIQEDSSSFDLPKDQCENLIGLEKVCVISSYSRAHIYDHEYSTQKPIVTVLDSRNKEEADFNHTATVLLIELIRQRFRRFLLLHSRPSVYKEVQEELQSRGFSFTLEKIQRKWNNLISTYRKIKEGNNEGLSAGISWDYYQLLDDLLGTNVLAVPLSESFKDEASRPYPQPFKVVTVTKPGISKKTTRGTSVHVIESPSAVSVQNQTIRVDSVANMPLSNQLQTLPHSTASVTTLLHHDGDSVFATQTIPSNTGTEEKSLRNIPDVNTIFLEYNLQQGEKRLDRISEHLQFMTEKATKRIEYKRKKERREELNLNALKHIGKASEDMKNRLLDI